MSKKQFNDGFYTGVLVSLQTLKNQGQETCAVEIVRGIGAGIYLADRLVRGCKISQHFKNYQ